MNDHDPFLSEEGRALSRRRLIRDATLLAGGAAAAGALVPGSAAAAVTRPGSPVITLQQLATPAATPAATPIDLAAYAPVNLTTAELTTLKAALDRLIPLDDLGPGANEAGVFVYIDRALGKGAAASLPIYQKGLAALDAAAGSGGFAGLDGAKQDELLESAEAGKLAGDPGGFFATLLNDTRIGMFADPIHGGNLNFAGWDLMRYPGVKLAWSAQDQAVNGAPAPAHISVAQYGGTAQ